MLQPGQRSHRVRIERRVEANPDAPSDYGNRVAEWAVLATVWAAFLAEGLRPSEGWLEPSGGGQRARLTVLRSAALADLDTEARIVFTLGPLAGQEWNIRSVVPTPDGSEILLLIESGIAT